MTKEEYRNLELKAGEALEDVRAINQTMRFLSDKLRMAINIHNALQMLLRDAWTELDEQDRRELMSEKDELPFSDVEEEN